MTWNCKLAWKWESMTKVSKESTSSNDEMSLSNFLPHQPACKDMALYAYFKFQINSIWMQGYATKTFWNKIVCPHDYQILTLMQHQSPLLPILCTILIILNWFSEKEQNYIRLEINSLLLYTDVCCALYAIINQANFSTSST